MDGEVSLLWIILTLFFSSYLIANPEVRESELNINFGFENKSDTSWYLWSEDTSDDRYQRSFENFYKNEDLHVTLQTRCQNNCKLEFKSDLHHKKSNPVFYNGVQANHNIKLELDNLVAGPYEVDLYIRSAVHPDSAHNTVAFFKSDHRPNVPVTKALLKGDQGISLGQKIRFPISFHNTSNKLTIQMEGIRPFILSGLTLAKFRERYRFDSYKLVELSDIDLGHSFNGFNGFPRTICAAFYGRDIILGIYTKRSKSCTVVTNDDFEAIKDFKIFEWDPAYQWLPYDASNQIKPIVLKNSYSAGDHKYCRVKHQGERYSLGRIKFFVGCQYILGGKLHMSTKYQVLSFHPQ